MSDLSPPNVPLKTANPSSPALPPTPQDVKRRLSVLAPRVDTAATTASGSTSATIAGGQSQFAPASPLMPASPGAPLDASMGWKKVSLAAMISERLPHARPVRSTKSAISQAPASSSALSSSGMSSTSEDEADTSTSAAQARSNNNNNNNQVPLSAISEADSCTDSDASSDAGGGGERNSRRARGLGVPVDQVTKAMERLRISRESSRLAESVALKGGYLMKKGERRKAWKRRWFVLRGGQLAMYKNEKVTSVCFLGVLGWVVTDGAKLTTQEYRLLRLIPLADIHTCSPIELKKHAHTFGIVTPKRTYYVKADSERDVRDWCQAVQRAKRDLATSMTVTSLPEGTSGDVTPMGKGARSPGVGKHVPNLPNLSTTTTAAGQGGSFFSSPELQPMRNFPSSPTAVGGPINGNEAGSALSSSYTSTSSGGGGGAGLGIPGTSATNRGGSIAPSNSFAPGAEGALGLRGADGNTLELNVVDAGLGAASARQRSPHRSSSIVSDRSTGRDSYLGVGGAGPTAGDYFGGSGPSRTSMSLNPPLSPGGGGVSSSEDEDGFDSYDATWAGGGSSTAPPASPGPDPASSKSQMASRQLTFADQPSTLALRSPQPTPSSNVPAPSTPGTGFTDPNKVILSGYLMKQGKRKTWRKRWFVLMSTRLMYSRSHMEGKIHRQIPLTEILDAIEFEGTKMMGSSPGTPLLGNGGALGGGSGGAGGSGVGGSQYTMPGSDGRNGGSGSALDHCFKIITPKRTFLVCAPSEEDEIKWLAALQCLVQRKNGSNGAVVGGVATMAGAGAGAGGTVQTNASSGGGGGGVTSLTMMMGIAPPVTRRPSALGLGRRRSVTDAAKDAVDEVERRYHPQSQAA